MAETFYFSHDYGARNDPKLVKLQMELGHEGKGIFWDLIEVCYEQGGYILETELKGISFALHSQYERITDVLTKYDLFKTDGTAYWSESVLKRLEQRTERSDKARQSVLKRWEDYRKNTNVIRTYNDGNTSKVKKSTGKERKGEDISTTKEKFICQVMEFTEYQKPMLEKFISYWTELNQAQTKMRFQMEKTWEVSKRLATWKARDKGFTNTNPEKKQYRMSNTELCWLTDAEYEAKENKSFFKLIQ